MLMVRLSRFGRKKKPFYKIIVMDSKNSRNGFFIEKIGYFNPLVQKDFKIKLDRLNYWLRFGAKISKRLESLVKYSKRNLNKSK